MRVWETGMPNASKKAVQGMCRRAVMKLQGPGILPNVSGIGNGSGVLLSSAVKRRVTARQTANAEVTVNADMRLGVIAGTKQLSRLNSG